MTTQYSFHHKIITQISKYQNFSTSRNMYTNYYNGNMRITPDEKLKNRFNKFKHSQKNDIKDILRLYIR